MKRRDFFKAVAGFVAGVCSAFVPKAKAEVKGYSCSSSRSGPSIALYLNGKRID